MAKDSETPTSAAQAVAPRVDKHIWGLYLALCLVSVIELYSASAHEVTSGNVIAPVIRHVFFLVMGLFIMLALQRTHYKKFMNWSYLFAIISGLAMLYTLKFGDYINGARRSFSIGGLFAVQPAEMVKISVAFMIAAILSKGQMQKEGDVSNKGVWLVLAVVVGSAALLFLQGLTNTLLLMGISISMMLVGGVGFKKMFKIGAAFLGLALIGGALLFLVDSVSPQETNDVVQEVVVPGTNIKVGVDQEASKKQSKFRFATWKGRIQRHFKKDKYNDEINSLNQQEQYSYIAQAHGGIKGVNPGNSRETARLPLAFSDYIYAIIIEETGLIGGICVLVLYLWLMARAGLVASRCQTAYPALLVIGMAVYITLQAMFHMGIVTGVFPVSGQPLPLISKGGTSILITSMALGVMLSVSRFAARKGKKVEIKEELKELPEELTASNPV